MSITVGVHSVDDRIYRNDKISLRQFETVYNILLTTAKVVTNSAACKDLRLVLLQKLSHTSYYRSLHNTVCQSTDD